MPRDPKDITASGPRKRARKIAILGDKVFPSNGGHFTTNYIITGKNVDEETLSGSHIVTETLDARTIAANAITAGKIEAGAITAEKIAANAVLAENIFAGAVTTEKLAAGAVTAEKIAAGTIVAANIEAGTITAELIAAEAITTEKLFAEAVVASKIAAGAITAGKISAGSIETSHLKAEAVTAEKIKADSITAGQIAAEAITTSELAANSVTSAKIAAATITGSDIAASTVTATNITITELSALSADLGTITAGTVTGATLRTAESGTRWEVNTEAMRAYSGATPVLDFDLETGNLKIKGTIEEGSTIPAGSITGVLTSEQIESLEAAKITGKLTGAQVNVPSLIFDIVAAVPAEGQAAMSEETAEPYEWRLKPSEAKYLAIRDIDKSGRELDALFQQFASSGEPFKAQILLTSASDPSRYALFNVKGKTENIGSLYYRWEIELSKGVAEFESGEELYFELKSGAVVAESITAGYVAAGAITTAKLTASAVTAEKIAASAVEASKIKAEAVEASKIKSEAIETSKLKANAVTAAKIAASTITATQIAGETITGAKIAAGTITAAKLSVETLSAISANLGTVTAGTIKSVNIEGGSITGAAIQIDAASSEGVGEGSNKLRWMDGALARGELYTFSSGFGLSHLQIRTNTSGGTYETLMRNIANPTAAEAWIDFSANNNPRTIVNQSGGSTFVQVSTNPGYVGNNYSSAPQVGMIWGKIGPSGEKIDGLTEFFTVSHTTTGRYTISFVAPFKTSPVIMLTRSGGEGQYGFSTYGALTKESFAAYIRNSGGTLANEYWAFIAIG